MIRLQLLTVLNIKIVRVCFCRFDVIARKKAISHKSKRIYFFFQLYSDSYHPNVKCNKILFKYNVTMLDNIK